MATETGKPIENQGVAYSYVRFSSARQELGDSLRRQVELAQNYCDRHGLTLHPVSYRDLGVSAFKRQNIERGALAAFIEAVRLGKVAKGSFLVIEQFDRLSRDDTDRALALLLNLVHSGIRVVTLVDERVWDETTTKETTNLILAIVYMSRANNESAAKAKRLSEAWGEKKRKAAQGEGSRIVTSECPRWLTANDTKTGFIPLPDRVESIKKVFQHRIGGFGISSIVTRANKEKWPVPGKPSVRRPGEALEDFNKRAAAGMTWHTSTVGRLLRNRALLGEYQPYVVDPKGDGKRIESGKPIPNYYPPVIDEQTFLQAQAKALRSGRFPGRRDASLKNWLQGLLRCPCGQSFVRKNKDSLAQPGYARYYCLGRNRGVTKCPGANAKELEDAVIAVVASAAPEHFQGNQRLDELKGLMDVQEVERSAVQGARDRYLEAIGSTKAPLGSLIARLEEAERDLAAVEDRLGKTRAEMADLANNYEDVFENIVRAVKDVDSLDARAALREELSRVIDKVVVRQNDGGIEVFLRGRPKAIWQPLDPSALEAMPSEPDATDTAEPFERDAA
jgi:DNA invertase Pin-like site-specific DNA recombinase